jgi:flagellar L-ring protein FlgH
MRALAPAVTLAALALASGCATMEKALEKVESDATRAARPSMSPLAAARDIPMPAVKPETASSGSLWKAGSRAFFADQRARRLGDILTVRIDIADSARLNNSFDRETDGATSSGVTSIFGKESLIGRLLPSGGSTPFDPANLIGGRGTSSASGAGTINRQERISLSVAAVVIDILPNGNMVIAGKQEVRINNELRELDVTGVIRPEDISPENAVSHDQMADARISYGGRGVLSTVQRPRLGQRAMETVSPY